jgi:hypothetical protein
MVLELPPGLWYIRGMFSRGRFLPFLLMCFLLLGACISKDTPRHSLNELRTALLNHDADTALRYIDVDSIVDCMVKDIFLKYEAKADSPLEMLGLNVGREAAKIIMPGVKELARAQVKRAITSPDEGDYFTYIRRGSVWYLIRVDYRPRGGAEWQIGYTFLDERVPDGYWRIVEIKKEQMCEDAGHHARGGTDASRQ